VVADLIWKGFSAGGNLKRNLIFLTPLPLATTHIKRYKLD
jgi:hypothetical protein